jgi:peptide/nickel transport system ATP-binding protein
VVALDGVTFEIAPGEVLGVLGESGCGKTTLGLALLGLLPPAGVVVRGSAAFCGNNLIGMTDAQLQEVRGAGISMVHQEPGAALNPVLRIGDQIEEVVRAHRRCGREQAREEAGVLLTQVGLLPQTAIAAAFPHQLSGGQQQRVAIAQAIACRPALLIADEPTTALDRTTQVEILDLLRRLRKKLDFAVMLISHDFSVLARAVDRMIVMRQGRIVQRGTAVEVAGNHLDSYTQSLLTYPPADTEQKKLTPVVAQKPLESAGHTARHATSRLAEPRFRDWPRLAEAVSLTTGTHSGLTPLITHSDSRTERSETLLFAVNLQKRYRQGRWPMTNRHSVEALYGVEIELEAGSALAVVGPSGSGKSTLARCLACLEKPDCGEIWYQGTDLTTLSDRKLVPYRRQIQMIFQDAASSLNPRFNAIEIVSEPLLADRRTGKECRERALDLMAQVGLPPDFGTRLPHEFSAGQRRRLAIARALSVEPRLLILDEALAGLDRPIQFQIADLLLRLQATLSLTYLHISHDLDLVAHLADRVTVLHRGQIVERTNTRQLLAAPRSLEPGNLPNATCELVALQKELA